MMYYIAETYREYLDYCQDENIDPESREHRFIGSNEIRKLMGLELSWSDVFIIGDPNMRFSFWQTLLSRITKPSMHPEPKEQTK